MTVGEWKRKNPPIQGGKPLTNADRIHSMRDEELAEFLANAYWSVCKEDVPVDPETEECMISCKQCWLDWLKQEVTE